MAFFGSTQIGYQDTIREHVKDPPITPQYIYRSGLYRDPTEMQRLETRPKEETVHASIVPVDQVSGYGAGHGGSHKEYTRLKNKHIKNPKGVDDVYRSPVTTSQEIATWKKDEPLKVNEPWAYVKRHVNVNSEMTKFVNDMSLTNREFSLF